MGYNQMFAENIIFNTKLFVSSLENEKKKILDIFNKKQKTSYVFSRAHNT